jgi:cytochrome c oxidase subunit 1
MSLEFINRWVSISAFLLGLSLLFFLGNFVYSLVFARIPAGANPWSSKSIEWQLPSPVPVYNFTKIPVFSSDPYGYGESAGPVAVPAGAPAGRD